MYGLVIQLKKMSISCRTCHAVYLVLRRFMQPDSCNGFMQNTVMRHADYPYPPLVDSIKSYRCRALAIMSGVFPITNEKSCICIKRKSSFEHEYFALLYYRSGTVVFPTVVVLNADGFTRKNRVHAAQSWIVMYYPWH